MEDSKNLLPLDSQIPAVVPGAYFQEVLLGNSDGLYSLEMWN